MNLQICETDKQIEALAVCAKEIWNEYFISLISQNQIDYMVEKFQSTTAFVRMIHRLPIVVFKSRISAYF